MDRKLYKVLVNGRSCHGGEFAWSLPSGDTPGSWHEVEGGTELCRKGFHLTWEPTKWWKEGAAIFEADVQDAGEEDASNAKIVVRKVRLLREVTDVDELVRLHVLRAGTYDISDGQWVACDSAEVTASGSAKVTAYGSAAVTASGSAKVTASGSAAVTAYDSAAVTAYGSAAVTAYDSAAVTAYDSAEVTAYGSAAVTAYDSAAVTAYDSAEVTACDSAEVTAYDSAAVTASGSAKVTAYGSAKVTAYGSAKVTAYDSAAVTACDSALVHTPEAGPYSRPAIKLEGRAVHVDQRGEKPIVTIAGVS